jgi:4-hydroxythreonine-4-phosphate dehydrogenase
MINGPINKTKTLNKKYLGMSEYVAKNFNQSKFAMLIYNKKLSVCPVTTHLPLKLVAKKITQGKIKEKIIIINDFYQKFLGFKPRIAVIGLNPHCESVLKFNEDNKILSPVIKSFKNKINVKGPFPADTVFLKNNRKKFDVIIGMYHDQVLTPIKTIFEYDAINITIGLPFLRVTPDHGPNEKMIGKNVSNPTSLVRSLEFLDKR